MFKLSKESKRVFLSLLLIPFIWIMLNHLGYLDYLKTKSLDWRLQFRGEIPQSDYLEENNTIKLPNGGEIPRVPKLVYVNFDAGTLEMDGVGERPWDRAFFRDTALALLEKGKARSIGFDFGFTPKSMSRMVPKENSYRSDMALADLVQKFPEQVVLGCLYSGVQTPFVKPTGASAFPPFLKDGYSSKSGKFHYPEAPTYPLINYQNEKYVGRVGSFTVTPYRAVDEIPRWVPLWYDTGGKAHAYNLLGGKQSVLSFELLRDNRDKIEGLRAGLIGIAAKKVPLQEEVVTAGDELAELNFKKTKVEDDFSDLQELEARLFKLDEEIDNFQQTLSANPALKDVVEPQIKVRADERQEILRELLSGYSEETSHAASGEQLAAEVERLKSEISTFEKTLQDNSALSEIIQPQIDQRITRRKELLTQIESLQSVESKVLSAEEIEQARTMLTSKSAHLEEQLNAGLSKLAKVAQSLQMSRESLSQLEAEEAQLKLLLSRYEGEVETELVESDDFLRLIYHGSNADGSDGILVDSLPNLVPLNRNGRIYALGVEALLAYYGLDDDAVQIDEEYKTFSIVHPQEGTLVQSSMTEGQFLEVNWFSKWAETQEEKILTIEAKRAYGDKNLGEYIALVPKIVRLLLSRVDGISIPPKDNDLPDCLIGLGVEETKVSILRSLINEPSRDSIPSFDEFLSLLEAISYYFIPSSITSEYNPMCGMKDVLQYAQFHNQVSQKIAEINAKIISLSGDKYLGKIKKALETDPSNPNLLSQKQKVMDAISANTDLLVLQNEELQRINSFFSKFQDSIVLIGPEEATFQDLAPTPLDASSVPKVSVHGNLIKTLTSGQYLQRLPIKIDHFATLLVCILMAFLAVYQGKRASLVQAGGILLLLGYTYLGFETFAQSHIIWPITAPACAGLSTSFIGLAAMVVIEQKAKGRLKGMFGSYVSSDLVEQMVASGEEPSLGGEETEITAFFSDVQAFSSFSELLTPTGLVDLMNEYLTAMTNILQEERGTLDKYIGDAIVAMYGAPIPMKDHAYQAVRTSILMQKKQIELRKKWVPEVEKWGKCHGLVTQMQTRIGCNTGTATVGNMGALDRFNYTMMGDMVNLAARCESGAKAYGAYIMVTEETKLASEKTKDDIAFRYLDKIVVKGRSQPVAMYEPTGFMSELTQETQDCLDCFQQGIDKYLAQDWTGALNLFEKAKEMEPNKPGVTPGVKDNPSMILIDRCKVMMENPPGDDWDGVYVMTTK
jgi:class 3 adenylate cyclase/CHASE2 domain-containing sensor protein